MNHYVMTSLELLTADNATPPADQLLIDTEAAAGFLPNMYAAMANSPAAIDAHLHGFATFRANAGFAPAEQEVILLTVSRENECEYCVAAHSTIAEGRSGVAPEVVEAIREGTEIGDPKLAALADMTRALMDSGGRVDPAQVERFLAAGYTEAHLLGIIVGIAMKTISNYTNNLFETPVDGAFAPKAWTRPGAASE